MNLRKNWWLIAIIVIAISVSLIPIGFKLSGTELPQIFPEDQTVFFADAPVMFSVGDQWKGGVVASATVDFYIQGDDTLEQTLTTDSDGEATSLRSYNSTTVFDVMVSKGDASYWYTGVEAPIVPSYDSDFKASQKDKDNPHSIDLDFFTLGTYTLSAQGNDGVQILNNGDLNKTVLGDKPTLSLTLRNTADNTGFLSSEDIIEGYFDQAISLLKISGTNSETVIVVDNWDYTEVGTLRYWGNTESDKELTKRVDGAGVVRPGYKGTSTIELNLDLSTYSGDAADLTFSVYGYISWDSFTRRRGLDSDAVLLATIAINIVD